ncbi:uncharacterized protein LOC126908969 [Daktulosphaira vitifoliae]|uniref:uncharacterized protein LOC126908969 n=1 Tax=Daktulosphaira vitifoliae TaxID=58002 RepID=UPI0021AA1110|nr:uncharacterized protein LOC126908969 [Daktulosphaira vitifoliae]
MNFYIFIVISLTRSLSNAILFKFQPLNEENSEVFNDQASTYVNNMFYDNKYNDGGMVFNKFKGLMQIFRAMHDLDENQMNLLFISEVGNRDELMTLDQFSKQILVVAKIIERKLHTIYRNNLNRSTRKMTISELMAALNELQMGVGRIDAARLIGDERANSRDISFPNFRNMVAVLYYREVDDVLIELRNADGFEFVFRS